MNSALPKQYLDMQGRSVIARTLDRLLAVNELDALVVGISGQDEYWRALAYESTRPLEVVSAGLERVDTVANCLNYIVACGGEHDWALVHDAARPCVRVDEIEQLIQVVRKTGQGGILAVPLSDTVKRSVVDTQPSRIRQTVPRTHLWRAMTPQLFKVGDLLSAIKAAQAASLEITDEASAMEFAGEQPLLLVCSPDNLKITLPQDLVLASLILQAQQQE